MHEAFELLQTLAIVLCTAAVTTVLFQRLRQPVVLGYLLAGLMVGPRVPVPVEAQSEVVENLAELGVILLMFALGLEFSLSKLFKVGRTAGFVAVIQCSVLIWLGYVAGQFFGWPKLVSFYAGAAISISSTTIIVKAFEEERVQGDFKQLVFGILIVEDLLAILLITILTTLSRGESLTAGQLGITAGRLAAFLAVLMVVGLLAVPRLMRYVVALDRAETTVVASVGLAFGFAWLARYFDYSAALGAFLAGALVAESGVEKKVEHLVQPVRDIFAAIFFVSVGMLIEPGKIVEHWPIVLVYLAIVLVGNIVAVSIGAFFIGEGIQGSVKAGMSLAQIGEFSFIIAGVGIATGATDDLLYSVAVAVSGITTLLTPWLIRSAEPAAAWVDRKLPRSWQTFAALYGAWIDGLAADAERRKSSRVRGLVRWLAVDVLVLLAIVIGAAVDGTRAATSLESALDVAPKTANLIVVGATAALCVPFLIGLIRVTRVLGFELADRVFPAAGQERSDLAAAPRRLLVVTLQLAFVMLVGVPLVAVTQPFLPPLRGAAVLLAVLVLLAIPMWRGATNLQGHTRAAAQALAELLGRQTREGREQGTAIQHIGLEQALLGLGSPVSVEIAPGSPAIGKTLAVIRLRGLTGATVLAIQRGSDSVLVPSGHERIAEGDILAIAGTQEAVQAAERLLAAQDGSVHSVT
ncbi:MAG: cation:proton antiporter [Pirellulales bacterium]